MNVAGIPFDTHPHAFWWITGFCVLVSLGIAAYFARIQWLRATATIDQMDAAAGDQASSSMSQ